MAKKTEAALANPDKLDTALQTAQLALVPRMQAIAVVETDGECEDVGAIISEAKGWTRRVEEWFEPMVKAAHAAHKALTTKRGDTVKGVTAEAERLQREVNKYLTAKKRRLDAIAIEDYAIERKRLASEAAKQVESLAKQGFQDEAMEVLDAARAEISQITPEKITASNVSAGMEKIAGVETWKFEITDGALIPRQFLMPDEKAILNFIRANKPNATIPGVRIYSVVESRIGRG